MRKVNKIKNFEDRVELGAMMGRLEKKKARR